MEVTNLYEFMMDDFRFCKSVEELYNSQRIVCGWFEYEVNHEGEWEEEEVVFVLHEGHTLKELEEFFEAAKEFDIHKNCCNFQLWVNNNMLLTLDADDGGMLYTSCVTIPMIPKSLGNKF